MRRILPITLFIAMAACGGGGGGSSTTPTTPTTPSTPTIPVSSACAAITQGSSATQGLDVVNGTECSTVNSPVVLLNMKDSTGLQSGSCTGTVIGARAILTAAHCLQPPAASVLVFLGQGPQQTADSFAAHPSWRSTNPANFDVGVVLMPADIGPRPTPLLLSRDARVGETAVITGWGRDANQNTATLRAGVATLTGVSSLAIVTAFTTTASSVCQGDSGGPLLLQEGGVWSIAGVISANSTTACSSGDNFYANVRAADNMNFILSRVPDATRR